MASALKTLRHMQPGGGRRIAILGDMLELGAVSAAAHTALKSQIEQSAIDCVFLAGQEIKALADILDPQTLSGIAENASDLLPMIISCLKEDDAVVVKASNDIGLSSIVKSLIDLASLEHAANRD
jgi:UDP-N-acetylmuramoyl-tripeptide--D-alanyl-D-alanine ligase